jgi:hypothetical protein
MTKKKPDRRYSVALEYCGAKRRRWIVRYCGEWVGMGKNRSDAKRIAAEHVARTWALDNGEARP